MHIALSLCPLYLLRTSPIIVVGNLLIIVSVLSGDKPTAMNSGVTTTIVNLWQCTPPPPPPHHTHTHTHVSYLQQVWLCRSVGHQTSRGTRELRCSYDACTQNRTGLKRRSLRAVANAGVSTKQKTLSIPQCYVFCPLNHYQHGLLHRDNSVLKDRHFGISLASFGRFS